MREKSKEGETYFLRSQKCHYITIGYKEEEGKDNIFTLETKHHWLIRKVKIKYLFIFTVAPRILFILASLAGFFFLFLHVNIYIYTYMYF